MQNSNSHPPRSGTFTKLCFVATPPLPLHHTRQQTISTTRKLRTQPIRRVATITASDTTKQLPMTTLPPGVTRVSKPFIVADMVTISDPELIRKVSARSDIGRPGTTNLPFLFRQFFYATKFYFPRDDSWAPAMLTQHKNEQSLRRQSTIDALASGFTQEQIHQIEALITGDHDLPTIGAKCAKIIAQVILPLPEGEQLPDEIAKASFDTLTEFSDVFNPFKILSGRKARSIVEQYVTNLLPDCKYPGDVVHDLGAAAQGLGKAVSLLQGKVTEEVVPTLTKNSMIKGVIRVPLTTTTINGMFPEDNPLIPDKTLIVMDIGTAAAESGDERFLFGVGTDQRQCPFKELFLATTNAIRNRNISD